MLKRSATPYLDFKVGYAEFLLYNPSIGITQKVGYATNLNLSLGLTMQHYIEYRSQIAYGVELKLGIELH